MNSLMDIVWIVVALSLIGVTIWAFQTYVKIPGPFEWVKGLLTFVLIAVACVFLWRTFVAGHFPDRGGIDTKGAVHHR